MTKKLTIFSVMEMSGNQMRMLLYPGKIHALYSDNVADRAYMVCCVDAAYRHNFPVVSDPAIWRALLGSDVTPGMELTLTQYERLIDGLHVAQENNTVGRLLQKVTAT